MMGETAMAPVTPLVLIATRDPDVKLVSAALQSDGIASRMVGSVRELQRGIASSKGRWVAVIDGDLADESNFSLDDTFEALRSKPLLVLLSADTDASILHDPRRATAEEYARKPIAPSVLA